MTVLVLGFEGYGGRGINPSEQIVSTLDGKRIAQRAVVGRVLPVSYDRLAATVTALIEEHRPACVIAIGLWPGEPVIRLERIAANENDFEIPDNAGAIEAGPIDTDGPAGRRTTLPVHAIRDALLSDGIPARLSGTPGNFLCNAMMYTILGAAERLTPAPAAGFIHVPYLPEQVADLIAEVRDGHGLELHQRADLPSMALETMVRAVTIAIEQTVAP
jgi:pyroglutamyl-peptidase